MSWDLLIMAAPPGVRMEDTGPTHAIELNLGDDEHVVGLGVRAHGDEATVEVLQRLCEHTGWRDESEDPATGLRGWRALRDGAVDDG